MTKDIISPFLPKNRVILNKYFEKEPKKVKKFNKNDDQYLYVIETFGEDYESNQYYKAWVKGQ